jgi:Zn ribbon nucleic-acid-binding protein
MTMLVPVSDCEFEMIGPYLSASARCPECSLLNRFAHAETFQSPVKPVVTCGHVRAFVWGDDGKRNVEFCNQERACIS